MRFKVQRESFLKPLKMVIGVVERKHTQSSPILSNVLLKAHGGQFSLTTTDQEIELVSEGVLEPPALEDGVVTVPIRKLMDICRSVSEGQVLSIIEAQNRITVRSGQSRFTLSTLPADNFPSLNERIGDFQFSISKKTFKLLLDNTAFAMAEQDVRYYLNGLLLEVRQGQLYSVAADGHRLALSQVDLILSADASFRVIVPRKSVLELQRILDDVDEEISIVLGQNHIRVITAEVQLTSKLLEGNFPDYERIVSTKGDKALTATRKALKEAFQRAGALFTDKFKGVRLQLTQGRLTILATNAEHDEAEEEVAVDYSDADLEIGFNIKYLLDCLSTLQTERVQLTFTDANGSVRIEGVGAAGSVYIIMPMRI